MAYKGRCTRYDFVAYDKLTTGLRHELFLINQTYNSLTIVFFLLLYSHHLECDTYITYITYINKDTYIMLHYSA